MDEREDEGAEEHGDVHIASLGEGLLQHAAEGQFLADSGNEGDDQEIAQQAPDGIDFEHPLGQEGGGFLERFEHGFEGLAEVDLLVPLTQNIGERQGDEHQGNASEKHPAFGRLTEGHRFPGMNGSRWI